MLEMSVPILTTNKKSGVPIAHCLLDPWCEILRIESDASVLRSIGTRAVPYPSVMERQLARGKHDMPCAAFVDRLGNGLPA